MRDRQQLETLLLRRFPGSSREQIAAAANAIMAMTEQWDAAVPEPAKSIVQAARGESDGFAAGR